MCPPVPERARPAYIESMILPRSPLILLLLIAGLAAPAFAQDTRGSLVPDTPVALMDGTTMMVQDLDQGTSIWTLGPDGKPMPGVVTAVRRQHADSYIFLKAGGKDVQATGSHRVALAGGKLVRIDKVKAGDKVQIWGAKGLEDAVVTSVREYPANLVAYDLTVEKDRPFLAGGVVVGD